jgi:hypothetical protein
MSGLHRYINVKRLFQAEKIIIYFCKIKKSDHYKKQRLMDFIKAMSIIRKDLDEASVLLDQMSLTPGANIAEIELARSRVHSATELLKLLPELNKAAAADEVNEARTEVIREAVTAAKSVTVEKEVTEVKEKIIEQTAAQQKAQEATKTILADRFDATGTIGEKILSPKKDEAITSVMRNKPISDIGAAIGINDKFYFIRELFSGDSRAYHDTISRLNSAASLGEAMKILDENTVMGSDPAAQSSFVDVVRRKFSIDV